MSPIFPDARPTLEFLCDAAHILARNDFSGLSMKTEPAATAELANSVLADAKLTDKVTILGHAEIDLLLALARKGFMDVSCRNANGPHVASDAADVVVAPAVANETELAAAATEARRALKQNGIFLARLANLSGAALGMIDDVLGRYGFAAVAEPGGLLCCRRLAAR